MYCRHCTGYHAYTVTKCEEMTMAKKRTNKLTVEQINAIKE